MLDAVEVLTGREVIEALGVRDSVVPSQDVPAVCVEEDRRAARLVRWELVLFLRQEDRLLHDKYEGGERRREAHVPGGLQAAPVSCSSERFLRVAAEEWQADKQRLQV